MCCDYLSRLYSSTAAPRIISNAEQTRMVSRTEVFLGSEGMETSGGPVGGGVLVYGRVAMTGGVPEGVEDAPRISVPVVRRVVLGLAWGR